MSAETDRIIEAAHKAAVAFIHALLNPAEPEDCSDCGVPHDAPIHFPHCSIKPPHGRPA